MKTLLRLFLHSHAKNAISLFTTIVLFTFIFHFIGIEPRSSGYFKLWFALPVFAVLYVFITHHRLLYGNLSWILNLPMRRTALLFVSAFTLIIGFALTIPLAFFGVFVAKYALALFEAMLRHQPFAWVIGPMETVVTFFRSSPSYLQLFASLTGDLQHFSAANAFIFYQSAVLALATLFLVPNGSRLSSDKSENVLHSGHPLNLRTLWANPKIRHATLVGAFFIALSLMSGSTFLTLSFVAIVAAMLVLNNTLGHLHLHYRLRAKYVTAVAILILIGDGLLYRQFTIEAHSTVPETMRESLSWLGTIGERGDRHVLIQGLLTSKNATELRRSWREIQELTGSSLLVNRGTDGVVYADGLKRWNEPETLAAWLEAFDPTTLKAEEIRATYARLEPSLPAKVLFPNGFLNLLSVPLSPAEVEDFIARGNARGFTFGVLKARLNRDADYIPLIRKHLAVLSGKFPQYRVELFDYSRKSLSVLMGRNINYDEVLPILKFVRSPASEGFTIDCTKLRGVRDWSALSSDQLAKFNVCLRERTLKRDPARLGQVLFEEWYTAPLEAREIEKLQFAFSGL